LSRVPVQNQQVRKSTHGVTILAPSVPSVINPKTAVGRAGEVLGTKCAFILIFEAFARKNSEWA
jgi:hypothetical protein